MKNNKRVLAATLFSMALMGPGLLAQNKTNNASSNNSIGDGGTCFDADSRILNVGIGLTGSYYNYSRGGGYSYHRTPAFSVSYEQAYRKKLGPGYLGIGGYFGFQHARYRYNYNDYYYGGDYYYQHTWNYFVLAARAAYHMDFLQSSKGELYFGVMAGVRIQTYKYETNSPYNSYYYQLNDGSVFPALSLYVGGRYYFKPKFGVFGELGYGISYLTLGVSFKL